jgi:hypothetical protein
MEVQRVLARFANRHGRGSRAERCKPLVDLPLMRSMEYPDLAHIRDQCPQLGLARLDVLVVEQDMRAGHRCARRRHPRNRMLRRVLHGILRELVPHRLRHIDLAMVRHLHEIEQHIGDLLADALLGAGVLVRKPRLVRRVPLEDLRQLGRLDHERCREVLGRVKRLPVSLRREMTQLGLQFTKVHPRLPSASASCHPRQRHWHASELGCKRN